MKVATIIKDLEGWRGHATLYSLDPPLRTQVYDSGLNDYVDKEFDHIVVSATIVPISGAETYIFPARYDGEIISWGELEGSIRGELNQERALERIGYTIAPAKGGD